MYNGQQAAEKILICNPGEKQSQGGTSCTMFLNQFTASFMIKQECYYNTHLIIGPKINNCYLYLSAQTDASYNCFLLAIVNGSICSSNIDKQTSFARVLHMTTGGNALF